MMIRPFVNTGFGRRFHKNLTVIFLFFLFFVLALNPDVNAQFAGGSGTLQDPYQISTVNHLDNIRTVSNTAHFKLIGDVDASATQNWNGGRGFQPITYFNGNIDGNNHTISGLYINRSGSAAILQQLGGDGIVRNLSLENISINGGYQSGSIVGALSGALINVTVSGSVSGSGNTGGLAGHAYSGSTLEGCITDVNLTSTGGNAGGLIGYCNGATVENCSSSGSVSGTSQVGGLIGKNHGNISGSFSSATVSGTGNEVGGLIGNNNGGNISDCNSSGQTSGKDNTGGLIGFNGYGSSSVTNCYSSSEVDGNKKVGGLIGFNQDGTIEQAYSTGDVNGKSETGGLVGYMAWGTAVIRESFSTSTVSGTNNNIGGLVGSLQQGTIENSYAAGVVSGNNKVGGLVGEMNWATVNYCFSATVVIANGNQVGGLIAVRNGGSVNDSFWDEETSGQSSSDGGTPRTTAEMLDISTFASWDFGDVWSIDPTINGGYPYLNDLAGFFMRLWTGALDTVWEKSENWRNNNKPQSDDNVRIPGVANQPVIFTEVSIASLIIQFNSQVTLAPNSSLTIDGTLLNLAGTSGLIINSTASGTGSLNHSTAGVPATFKRYIPGEAEAWHILSSPMTNQPISGSFTPSGTYADGTGYDFYTWYEPDTSWIYLLNDSYPPTWLTANGNNNFLPGRGYLVSYEEQYPTLIFEGTLNAGEVNVAVSKTPGTGTVFGSNQLGNPYSSSIDWKAASGWNRNSLEQISGGYSVWVWNDTAQNYGVYNSASVSDMGTLGASRYIAPTQGFFVQAAQNGNVSMNDNIRVADSAVDWFKSISRHPKQFNLCISSVDAYGEDEIMIGLANSGKSSASVKRFSFVSTAPALWIPDQGQVFSSLLFDSLAFRPVIPVGFRAGASGTYRITTQFDTGIFDTAILLDQKTNQRIDLMQTEEYLFQASPRDEAARFVLQFKEGNFPDPFQPLPVRAFAYAGVITIDLRLIENDCGVQIFDAYGKLVFDQTIAAASQTKFSLSGRRGVYIIRIQNDQGRAVRKIVI